MVCMWVKAKRFGRMSGDTGAFIECEVNTDDIRSQRRQGA